MRIIAKYFLFFAISSSIFANDKPASALCSPNIFEISYLNTQTCTASFEEFQKKQPSQKKRKSRLDVLYKENCTGQVSITKIITTVGMILVTPIACSFIGYYAQFFASKTVIGGAVGAAGGFTVGGVLTGSYIEIFKKGQSEWFTVSLDEGLKTVHQELKKDSEALVMEHRDSIRNAIESIDTEIASLLNNKDGEHALKCLRRREEVLLRLPTPSQINNVDQSGPTGDALFHEVIEQKMQNLIERYPQDNKHELELLVQKIRDNSIQPKEQANRIQAYIHGKIGTGKTEFVRLLGANLGLYVCHLKLQTLDLEELTGIATRDEHCNIDNKKVIGKIAQCFIEAGVLNPIIFFDDVGAYLKDNFQEGTPKFKLQQGIKDLLKKNRRALHLPGLGTYIDTSRATFIVESSEKPEPSDKEYASILNNFDVIEFFDLTRVEKQRAAERAIVDYLKKHSLILNENVLKNLQLHANKCIEYILDEDAKRNNPGASMIQEVIIYLMGSIRLEIKKRNGVIISEDDHEALELFKRLIEKRFNQLAPLLNQVALLGEEHSKP